MSKDKLEEMFIEAADSPTEALLGGLLEELGKIDEEDAEELGGHLEMLAETWGEDLNPVKAEFIVSSASLGLKDSAVFRKTLTDAIKRLLPPYLNKTGLLRSLGLRDSSVELPGIVSRYRTLVQLKNGVFTYQGGSRMWGVVTGIDDFAGSVAITALNGSNSFAVPLETVLTVVKIFHPSPDTRKLAPVAKPLRIVANEYREIAYKNALNGLSEAELLDIAKHTLIPEFLAAEQFDGWWRSEAGGVIAGMGRKPSDARSIHELHVLLGKLEGVSNFKFNDDDADKLATLFARVAVPRSQADNVTLAEAIAMLVGYMDKTMLTKVLEPLKKKALFWPSSLESVNLEDLEVWGKIPVKSMPEFIKACEYVFPTEYLSRYATLLPLRCLNLFCEHMDDELLTQAILETRDCGSDILLWIWRNRKTHSEHLSSMVNIRNVVSALSQSNLPASRSSAQRELKKQLIDKRDFQEHLIDCEDDVVEIVYALQGARFFMPGEQQSLLVKLSRVSDELRNLLASGQGKRLMSGGRGGDESQGSELPPQPTITSVRSHRALIKELEDIVKIHIPENRESLKVARAHGDFRENSEYDAAKERRNFLSNRRNELEHEIASIQPINFRNITVEDRIVIGSSVDFVYDNGKRETFHILGAWDGEPERNWLSYKTRLGEMLMGRKVGDKLEMPDGRKATVSSVHKLPAEIVEILADGE